MKLTGRMLESTNLIAALFLISSFLAVSSPDSANADSSTLRIPLGADIGVPDPDIFYAVEGLVVTTNVYDGLVRYKAGTNEIEPALAEKFEVSGDGLQYTFHIRPNVKFHDGTSLDAAAIKTSFERRIKLQSGPSYMLADVAEMTTPDVMTLQLTLKRPVSAFMDWLAGPYAPRAISPKALSENGGSDLAQGWLGTHDAGTGPYMIGEWNVGIGYTLKAFDGYWDGAPFFKTVEFPIVPDASTRALQLEQGDLDMILSGLPTSSIDSFRGKSGFQVLDLPAIDKAMVLMRPDNGVLADPDLRQAIRKGLDRKSLVNNVYGMAASVSSDFYPEGLLPDGMAPDDPKQDMESLKAKVASLPKKELVLAVPVEYGVAARALADSIQVQLAGAGLEVSVHDVPIATIFDMVSKPELRPDALLLVATSDTANPDAHIRIYFYTGAPVNSLGCSVPQADAAMDKGLYASNKEEIQSSYVTAAKMILDAGCVVNIADVKDTVIAKDQFTGITHDAAVPTAIRLGDVKLK